MLRELPSIPPLIPISPYSKRAARGMAFPGNTRNHSPLRVSVSLWSTFFSFRYDPTFAIPVKIGVTP
jgi:hypothetical protein